MGTRTQHWESFCLWLPVQTGQGLKSEVENDCWVANFRDLTNPKQKHHLFCTLSSQKWSFHCSQHGNFRSSDKTMDGFLLRNRAKVRFSVNTQYILFPLIVCSQCSLAPTAPRPWDTEGYRPPAHAQVNFQYLSRCLWTPWHSSPWQRHYPPWEQCGHSAVFRAP